MKKEQAIKILEAHNKWRRDNNTPSIYPMVGMRNLGVAIDLIVDEYKATRKSTEIKDKNGDEIFFGDTLVFVDKWEWYKRSYGPKFYFADNERKEQLRKEYEAEPLEERLVKNVQDYEWLLSGDLQQYWEIKK